MSAKHEDQITPTGKHHGQHKCLPCCPNKLNYTLSNTKIFHPIWLCSVILHTMTTILNPTITLIQTKFKSPHKTHHKSHRTTTVQSSLSDERDGTLRRKFMLSTLLGGLGLSGAAATSLPQKAQAEELKWGTRSFLWEHFFEPGLSPEDAVARIKNTAEGLHSLRHMLDTMSWRYVIFYIRLKQAYLKQDMNAALALIPEGQRNDYVNAANELVDNMAEFDYYVRTPKVYESYLFYEKTLKSIDNLVTFLA